MNTTEAIEKLELIAFSLSMSGHHIHADGILEALAPIKRSIPREAVEHHVQRTACPVPHPQADFEFICDLCGQHVPARRR